MPEIMFPPNHSDISIFSNARTKKEYWFEVKNAGCYLFVDGHKAKKLKKGDRYILHLIDKKIDHIIRVPRNEFSYWEWDDIDFDTGCPEEWCDGCVHDAEDAAEYEDDRKYDEIPF